MYSAIRPTGQCPHLGDKPSAVARSLEHHVSGLEVRVKNVGGVKVAHGLGDIKRRVEDGVVVEHIGLEEAALTI